VVISPTEPLVPREEGSHWYLVDGTPYHEVPRADGKGMRPVTLRDARKVGALPSTTNYLGIIHKPQLSSWLIETAITAALTLPRNEGESADAFARRVVEDMRSPTESATGIGSAVHNAAEKYGHDKTLPEEPKIAELFAPLREWMDTEIIEVAGQEFTIVNSEWGYAGRVDLLARLRCTGGTWCVADFKTQKVRKDADGRFKPTWYETWPMQLAAYREGIRCSIDLPNADDMVSIVAGSTEPMPVAHRVWPRDDFERHWRAFVAARDLWTYMKGYEPVAVS
jgi:hypothetical protein